MMRRRQTTAAIREETRMIGGAAVMRWPSVFAAGVLAALVWCGIGADRAGAATQTSSSRSWGDVSHV
jgi:hypothetical protein